MSWWKSAISDNLGLKAVCFFFALLLVAYHRGREEDKTRTVEFALDVQLPPEKSRRELMTALPARIKVTVQGSSSVLDTLASSAPSLELDLRSGIIEHVRFEPAQFDLPPGLSIGFIEPASLHLEWQDVISREIPVQTSVTGQVAEGYEVHGTKVAPERVELTGPASLVKVTQFVRVAPFDVTGLSAGTYDRQLALDPPPNRTRYSAASNVTVSVEIRRRVFAVPFRGLDVELVGITGARTTPAQVDVTVKGPPEVVKALQQALVVPRVDLTGIDTQKHGSKVVEVTVDLTGAQAEVQPPSVKVTW